MNLKQIILIIIITLNSFNAYAYIDPGTTSLIISAIIALFATIGYYFRLITQRIKELLKKIKNLFIK